jgi:hypothetical protein
MTEDETNPLPVAVRVREELPASADVGVIEFRTGEGFGVGPLSELLPPHPIVAPRRTHERVR